MLRPAGCLKETARGPHFLLCFLSTSPGIHTVPIHELLASLECNLNQVDDSRFA